MGKGGRLKHSSLAVLEQGLLCACKWCRVSAMTLSDPNASDLRPIFSFSPLPVSWALLYKLQSGVNEKSSPRSFRIHLCHLHVEFSSVNLLLLWENRVFMICPVACYTLESETNQFDSQGSGSSPADLRANLPGKHGDIPSYRADSLSLPTP